jgi:hypothetical protein
MSRLKQQPDVFFGWVDFCRTLAQFLNPANTFGQHVGRVAAVGLSGSENQLFFDCFLNFKILIFRKM